MKPKPHAQREALKHRPKQPLKKVLAQVEASRRQRAEMRREPLKGLREYLDEQAAEYEALADEMDIDGDPAVHRGATKEASVLRRWIAALDDVLCALEPPECPACRAAEINSMGLRSECDACSANSVLNEPKENNS